MAKNPPASGGVATQAQPPAAVQPAASEASTTAAAAPAAEATKATPADAEPPAKKVNVPPENHGNTSREALELLDEVCALFGVDPDVDARPRQLLAWTYYRAMPLDGVPAAVVIVTGGGKKLKVFEDPDYQMDPDTEERLAGIFNAYEMDPVSKNMVRKDLPDDLTLPLIHVTGVSTHAEHRYQGGYLKSGGKTEAAKRATQRDKRK